jgi:hypothetical protein
MRTVNALLKFLFTAFLFLNLTNCDDEVNSPEEPTPDSQALIEWFNSGTDKKVQRFTINASTGGNVVGAKGTIIKLTANALTSLDGSAVTGDVDIELIEIYDRASMLLTKKPTNGKKPDGSISTLVSGGEFYVNAFQNGVALKPKSGFTIIAPTENSGAIDQEMGKFNGLLTCDGDNCNLVWEEDDKRGIDVGEFQATGGFKTAYYVFQTKFGWTNIDRWYNDPRPKTTIFVDVPPGFDNTNCAVFITYDGEPMALAGFDQYDEDKRLFTEHYGLIPVGLKVHFILVSIIDDQIHYGIQGATIVENHVEVFEEVQSITEADLIALIGELP